jgi:hypothetical protein
LVAEVEAGGTDPNWRADAACPGFGSWLVGVWTAGDTVKVFFLRSQAFTDGGGAVGLVEGADGGVTASACCGVVSFALARQLPSSAFSATVVAVADDAVSAARTGEAAVAAPLDPFTGVDDSDWVAFRPAFLGVCVVVLVDGPAGDVEVGGVLVAEDTLPQAGLLLDTGRTRSVLPADVDEVDGFGLALEEPASALRLLLEPLRFFSSSSLSLASFCGRSRQFLDAFACDFFSL